MDPGGHDESDLASTKATTTSAESHSPDSDACKEPSLGNRGQRSCSSQAGSLTSWNLPEV